MKAASYIYECPRCNQRQTLHVKAIEIVCENYEAHHSNRSYVMELIDKPDSVKAD